MNSKPSFVQPENFIPSESIFSKEPQCTHCTHYEPEHMEGTGPCTRTLGHIIDPDIKKAESLGGPVIHPSVKCDCQKFVPKDEK